MTRDKDELLFALGVTVALVALALPVVLSRLLAEPPAEMPPTPAPSLRTGSMRLPDLPFVRNGDGPLKTQPFPMAGGTYTLTWTARPGQGGRFVVRVAPADDSRTSEPTVNVVVGDDEWSQRGTMYLWGSRPVGTTSTSRRRAPGKSFSASSEQPRSLAGEA